MLTLRVVPKCCGVVVLWSEVLAYVGGHAASLFDSLQFKHEGIVKSSDQFTRSWISALYLECENCSKSKHSWAINGSNYLVRAHESCYASAPLSGYERKGGDIEAKPIDGNAQDCAQRCCEHAFCKGYVFAVPSSTFMDCVPGQMCCFLKGRDITPSASETQTTVTGSISHGCSVMQAEVGYDRPGGDMSASPVVGGREACAARCCSTGGCGGYVFAPAPGDFEECKTGDQCCYLKSQMTDPVPSSLPGIVTASVTRSDVVGPPIGMRSAVPLGGVGAGSIEIRADGSVAEVTIVNQSPAGAAKMGIMDGLIFAVQEGSSGVTKLLRTQPPVAYPAEAMAAALRYSGAYPVSRLELLDPAMQQLNATLFALSRYKVGDLGHSTLPAVALSLEARNSGAQATDVSFLVTLPLSIEEHYARNGSASVLSTSAQSSPTSCLASCHRQDACVSWMWESSTRRCSLMGDAPLGAYSDGVFSGIKGIWSQLGSCLTLNRAAGGPAAGNASLCASESASVSFATAPSPIDLYTEFASAGNLSNDIIFDAAYGAAAVSLKLLPGDVADLSLALSWYFPDRDYMGTTVGNFYSTQYADSANVGTDMLEDLASTVQDAVSLQRPFFASTLPQWLADMLLNSISHVRSAWYQKNGHWRQWEAYDCVNVDSIHNDGERHIPYLMLLTETTRNKMHAWGKTQQANGMLAEQLACGCTDAVDPSLDRGCGRVMSDVSSMYVVYLLELYKWANDTASVKALWPIAKRAAEWHLAVANASGVPENQCNTYDILSPQSHKQVSYNSVFHLLAMRAAEELARSPGVNDQVFADTCASAFKRGQKTLDANQWIVRGKSGGYYSFALEDNSSLMVDTFYPQVLSYTLGLGPLVNEDRLQAHLDTELEWNDSPYGLIVKSSGYGQKRTNGVWQMGPPNWATLNIHLGHFSVPDAMEQPKKSLQNWRASLKDLWNVAGVADQDTGLPSVTSHYGYFMSAWHLPLAISGQQVDLPLGRLTFDPRVATPYALPLLLPGVLGLLRSAHYMHFEIELTIGTLEISTLAVSECLHDGRAKLEVGKIVSWNCAVDTYV